MSNYYIRRAQKRRRLDIKRNYPDRETIKALKIEVITKYNGICQCCFQLTDKEDYTVLFNNVHCRKLGPKYPTLQHIESPTKNGNWNIENLTLYCNKCNTKDNVLPQPPIPKSQI